MAERLVACSAIVLAGAVATSAFAPVLAHDGDRHELAVEVATRQRVRCHYVLDSRQDFQSGRVVAGERQKSGIVFEFDPVASTVRRADRTYPARFTDDRIEFRIGAVDYVLEPASGRLSGFSDVATEAAQSRLSISGSCTPAG